MAPPRVIRRLADAFLAFTAASAPLSISGMEIGMAGLFVLALAGQGRPWNVVRRTPIDGALAAFWGVCALSTVASGHLRAALPGWLRPLWLQLAYFGVFWWLRDRDHARAYRDQGNPAGVIVGAYGVLQHFEGVDWYRALLGRAIKVRPRVAGAEAYAVVGFFANYLTYANAMIFPLAWAGAFALCGRVMGAVAALLLTATVVYSTARGVWIADVAGGAALAVLAGRRRGLMLIAVAVTAAVAAVVVSPGLREQAAPIFTLGGVNAGRTAIYRANLEIVHDNPWFGLGFGRYKNAAVPYYDRHPDADRRTHAHSNVLQLAAEAGLLGLTAFCTLFAVILRRGFVAVRQAADPGAWATAAGAWVGIVTFLVAGVTEYNFGDAEVVIGMWLATAVLMRCAEEA